MITTTLPKLTGPELHAHLREIAKALGCTVTGGSDNIHDSHQYVSLEGPRLERLSIGTDNKSNGTKIKASIDTPRQWGDRFVHHNDEKVPPVSMLANKSVTSIVNEIRSRLYSRFEPVFATCLERKAKHEAHIEQEWELARDIGSILGAEPMPHKDNRYGSDYQSAHVGKTELKSPIHQGKATFGVEWVMQGATYEIDGQREPFIRFKVDAPPSLAAEIARLIRDHYPKAA